MPEDLKFYFSGGYFNSEPKNSIGGETSSFALVSGSLNGLFDRVDTAEATSGDVEYRCIYLRNTSQTRKLLNARIWIETGTASADTGIAISIGSSGINGTEPLLPDEGIEPPMNFFEIPLQEPEEPNIGDLYPGDHVGLWVRWIVQPGTQSIANDFAVIRVDGEREPESITDPLPENPPGTTPPPSTEGCPAGSKWSPVEARCVDDSTVIICPNGYTYNNTTQRCVPPTTPPPSIPNWTFGAAGDFSCTSDADATMALIGSKLNKTAGNDVGLFLALGDYSYEDGDQSCWLENVEDALGPTIYPQNVAPSLGNHDDEEDGAENDRTDIIAEFPLMTTAGYYAFTRRNIRFIIMDTQSSYSSGSQQHTFATQQLQQARSDPTIKWIIVSYHKPSFTTLTNYAGLTDFRNLYHPLFDQYKVDLIFNGHNHVYFRSKPVKYDAANPTTPIIASDQATGNYINIDGRIHCTVGTGGRSSHTEFDNNTPENFVGFRHAPTPYGAMIVTLQDNGNQLKCQFITNGNQVLDDFTISKPSATPPPAITCPQGFHYDDTQGRCIVSPTTCPTLYRWEPAQNKCVPISGTPPPTDSDPLLGVEWYYDSTATQNSPQTINAGSYDATEGIILCSADDNVTSTVIQNGYIHVKSGTGIGEQATGRIYFDYWKKSRWSQSGDNNRAKFNTAFLMTFVYENQRSLTVFDGNNPSLGFTPNTTFGGFGYSIGGPLDSVSGLTDASNAQVKYSTNNTDFSLGSFSESVIVSYPGNRTLENGKTYKVFSTVRTNRTNQSVVLNMWLDFGDGTGWVKIQTDTTYSSSNWNPDPAIVQDDRLDSNQIFQGPSFIERYHIGVRNNFFTSDSSKPDLRIKDVKIGTLPFLGDVNNPPGGTDPPPGGGGTGGVLDNNGIRWFWATGQQGVINQTRNESSDDRWSGNVDNVSQYGYECTMYLTIPNISSGGHFAMKSWGPNHSGDCGYSEGGDCCCWYDLGVRANGDIQQEIERPHPSNDSFNKGKVIQNIGRGLQGQTTGLKWVIHPQTPGGSADNGGIKIQMWVDTSGLSNGRPQNQWRKAMDLVDTGDILGDYPNPNFEHDLEVRNSDSSGQTSYAGGLHWRKIQANDTDQSNVTPPPSGGGGTTPPPSSGTAFKILSWGDNDTTNDAEEVLDQMFTETSVEQYLFAGDGPYSTSSTSWINMMSQYFNNATLKGKLMLAQGNHEHPESESQQSEDQIEAWFPGLHNSNEGLEWLQAKKVRNTYIIVMNSQDDDIDQVGGAQYNWVQARLNDAVALRNSGQIDWIICMVHKSWFNLLGSNPAYVTARHAYASMFRTAQVDFMFHGHNHSYAMWKPIVDIPGNDENTASTAVFTMSGTSYNFAVDHGTCYIINGNGGHEINGWGEDPDDFPNISYANDTEFGYTVLEIDGKVATAIAKSVGGNVRHTMRFIR